MSAYHAYESCSSCLGKAQPGTVDLLKYLMNRYPTTYSLGVYNCRLPSLHSCGKALDLGIPLLSGGKANTALGDPIVIFLDQYAHEFGLMGQIWNRARYDLKTPEGRYYSGPHPHHDHNHVEQRLWHAQNLRYADYVRIAGDPAGGIEMPQLPLKHGMDNEDVRNLQDRLNRAYGSGLKEDAVYGDLTAAAVATSPMPGYTGDDRQKVLEGKHVNANMWNGLFEDWVRKIAGSGGGLTKAEADQLYQQAGTIPSHGHRYAREDHQHDQPAHDHDDRYSKLGHGHKGTVVEKTEVTLT